MLFDYHGGSGDIDLLHYYKEKRGCGQKCCNTYALRDICCIFGHLVLQRKFLPVDGFWEEFVFHISGISVADAYGSAFLPETCLPIRIT